MLKVFEYVFLDLELLFDFLGVDVFFMVDLLFDILSSNYEK